MDGKRDPAIPPRHERVSPTLRCTVCGKDKRDTVPFGTVRTNLALLIAAEHPNLSSESRICRDDLVAYRMRYVEDLLARERGELSALERQVVESLAREETVSKHVEENWREKRRVGEKVADMVAEFGGSWTFIGLFFTVLAGWMAYNLWAIGADKFDPYPFILLNLVLSCLAAVQAPIIMMSQKRQESKDRLRSENDYRVNLKAELEIRHLHEKVDHLINRQWERLAEIQQIQLELMDDINRRRR